MVELNAELERSIVVAQDNPRCDPFGNSKDLFRRVIKEIRVQEIDVRRKHIDRDGNSRVLERELQRVEAVYDATV